MGGSRVLAETDERFNTRLRSRQISPVLIDKLVQILDPAIVGCVGLATYAIYLMTRDTEFGSPYIATIFIAAGITCVFSHWFDVYAEECMFSRRLPVQRLLAAWAAAFAVLLFIAFALKVSNSFSRVWAVTWFFGAAGALAGTRLIVTHWIFKCVDEGALAERSIIFGAGEHGQRFAAQLKENDDPHLKVLGFIDDRKSRVPGSSQGYNVLGGMEKLLDLIRANMVDQVFIALPWSASERLTQIFDQLALTPVKVCLVTDTLGFECPNRTIKFIGNVPTLQIFDLPLTGWSHVTKEIEDRLIALLILIFIAPLLALIALAIKLDSPGPVIFRQKRYGFNQNLIEVWKFRTMYSDGANPGGAMQATKNDPRVTRLGRFLRKSSLDELPQFVNVLLGDMSIVGPRPHPVELTSSGRRFEEIVDRYAARHRVKPGITGWAQVNGWRGETDTVEKVQKRVEHDLYYIDNWSVWFDFLIIIKTIFVIFNDDSAY
jgi:Undecaprenyl-phosphate glucose phosphotransferase